MDRPNLPQAHRLPGLHAAVLQVELEAVLRERQRPVPRQPAAPVPHHLQHLPRGDEGVALEDPTLLGQIKEFDEMTTNHIQPIFPQLVVQQIHNTLVARQLLPKGPSNFELVFHFFGYEDDTPEMRELRLLQANLVGPAGYISMEDTEATELVQRGTVRDGDKHSYIAMAREAPDQQDTVITENLIRRFWVGYQKLMDY